MVAARYAPVYSAAARPAPLAAHRKYPREEMAPLLIVWASGTVGRAFAAECRQGDIAAGEEITCNYAEFDPSFVMQPGAQLLHCLARGR